ncbi:hypothetical protein A3F03_02555 [Candidatus Roizmanbacteria bacterium RIFCSPHIGHO2_12_FULL_41_11]|uniref:ABC transporter permease n=3 Tax=Candidatus Roizmaniibacteriota TaxID=1752723 RepID=A0A1F7JQY9_9BACT|nr:MAG: hypothetical protein A3F03_02555 [Candidatus Roizmanbacteria bacterium RIFCSPHIGHO2_12_FULL_41_11]OGK51182.1 MAG: hypothetical protein A2966_00905 [Candidatus Roizmanbacteria bacterium RIFCSPLOWO2_01_FULL_41_22]OGK58019.1 MAG: hypothetical protein A3H86_01375 [Candidatus Roizmanbacteria bacterium RIFCSPLOWO2_02_FULL_41_9]
MRLFRIFLLHFQSIAQHRTRSLVWFLLSLFNPFMLLLFWTASAKDNQLGIDLTVISTYYLLLVLGGSTLMAHQEEDVAVMDIQKGALVKYLLRPIPYYFMRFSEEMHYRILQGGYGIVAIIILSNIFQISLKFVSDPLFLVLALVSCVLAYLLSFTYKMLLGILAFWLIETRAIFEFAEVVTLILCGFLVPLDLLPSWLKLVAQLTPFPYMIYYPLSALIGQFSLYGLASILAIQACWLGVFFLTYKLVFGAGIKRFTAVGQ